MNALIVYDAVFGNTEQVARDFVRPKDFPFPEPRIRLEEGGLERAADWGRLCGGTQ